MKRLIESGISSEAGRISELLEGYRPERPRVSAQKRRRRRADAERFERDYTAMLLALASSVRTGSDPICALVDLGALFPADSPLAQELSALREALDGGLPEEEALRGFAAEIAHPDLELFRSAMVLSRREGSSLTSCLQRLARFTRRRQSFRRKMKAAVAMQRLSSIGIGCCAAVIALMQYAVNRKGVSEALAHPLGRVALACGALCMLAGFVWMAVLTRSRL